MRRSAARGSFVSRATPLYFFGDSNALIFDDLLFERPESFEQPFITRSRFFERLRAKNFTDADGLLNAELFEAMSLDLLISGDAADWRGFRSAPDRTQWREFLAATPDLWLPGEWRHLRAPKIAFCVGALDHAEIVMQLGPTSDFVLPEGRYGPCPIDFTGVVDDVPLGLVEDLVAQALAPLRRGLTTFAEKGFDWVYLLALRPPSLDDEALTRTWQFASRPHLRYKVAMLMNERMAAVAAETGARFIDLWNEMTINGVFDERFELDHMHTNKEAAFLAVERILDDIQIRPLT